MFQPSCSQELNPVEQFWEELREKHFHNRLFENLSGLEYCLEKALLSYEQNPKEVFSLTSWDWIANIILNESVAKIKMEPCGKLFDDPSQKSDGKILEKKAPCEPHLV